MLLTPTPQKAINKVAVFHLKQKRKADSLPYIVHSYSVAWILSNYTDDEKIIIAGLLHDVLEDVEEYGEKEMKKDFGQEIVDIVKEVTEKDKSLPWR